MKETTNQEMYRAIWLSVGVTLLGFLGGLAADFLWEMYQKANPDLAFKFGITAVIGFFGLCGFLLIFSFFKEFQASLEKPQKSNNRSSGESEATSDVDPNQKKKNSKSLKFLKDHEPVIAIFSAFMVAGAFLYNTNLDPQDPQYTQLVAGSIFLGGFYGILWVSLNSVIPAYSSRISEYMNKAVNIFFIPVIFTHLATGVIGLYLIIPKSKPSDNLFLFFSYYIQLLAGIMILIVFSTTLITMGIKTIYKRYKRQ